MGPLFDFLKAVRSLAAKGDITVEDAYRFGQQQFGEVSELLKLQINKIFRDVKAPSIKLPAKDPDFDTTVQKLPYDEQGKPFNPSDPMKKYGQEKEGIETLTPKPKLSDREDLQGKIRVKYQEEARRLRDEGEPELTFEEYLKQIDEADEFANGGRVGLAVGGLPKGIQALVKTINKKFGKGAVKTADEMDRPKFQTEKKDFEKFESRNPDLKRQMTDDEYQDFLDDVGGSEQLEAYEFDGTVGDARRILKEQRQYEADAFADYKAGRLDPQPGEKGRKEFLEKKMEEMEMSGDKKLMTRDEIEELSIFDLGSEIEQLRSIGANKLAERLELTERFPGLDKDLLDRILIDDNPQRKAEVIATLEESYKMLERGMDPGDIIETFKKTPRTKQANGGLTYLMGL